MPLLPRRRCRRRRRHRHYVLQLLKWLRDDVGAAHSLDSLVAATVASPSAAPAQLQWLRALGGGDWSPQGA
jgi:hypothetical protein